MRQSDYKIGKSQLELAMEEEEVIARIGGGGGHYNRPKESKEVSSSEI